MSMFTDTNEMKWNEKKNTKKCLSFRKVTRNTEMCRWRMANVFIFFGSKKMTHWMFTWIFQMHCINLSLALFISHFQYFLKHFFSFSSKNNNQVSPSHPSRPSLLDICKMFALATRKKQTKQFIIYMYQMAYDVGEFVWDAIVLVIHKKELIFLIRVFHFDGDKNAHISH